MTESLGWAVVLRLRGGLMVAPTCWTDDRQGAVDQAYVWAASLGLEVLDVSEVNRVMSRGFRKRV